MKQFFKQSVPSMINVKFLLQTTIVAISIVYYFIFPVNKIVNIIIDEYIMILLTILSVIIYFYFKRKLSGKQLYEFIPNTNYVPIKSTIIFFAIFQVIDYISEDGIIEVISLWFMYWIFGLFAYFLTHIINFYKNYQAYKKQGLI